MLSEVDPLISSRKTENSNYKEWKELASKRYSAGPRFAGVHSWDEPSFPHSSLDGTMFCIYNENRVDNTGIF